LKWLKGAYRFRRVDANIYAFSPFTVEHILASIRFKPLLLINKYLLKRQIRKALSKIGVQNEMSIFVLHRPELYFLKGLIGERGTVYDCQDDNCSTSRMVKIKVAGNREREKLLSENCKFIFTTSGKLFKRIKEYNKNTFLVPNGFSSSVFDNCVAAEIKQIESLKKPIIGYIGTIRDWFDFELLKYLFSRKPDCTFLFVGNVKKESQKDFTGLIRQFKNVVSISKVQYSEYPNYLQYFDIGIIPFRVNEFMESVNPNKLYEYLGSGIPVVSTQMGDIEKDYYPYAKVGHNKEEFLRHIEGILSMTADSKLNLKNEVKEFGKQFTWERNARKFYECVQEYCFQEKA